MTAKGLFPTYHPVVGMLFFVAAVCFSFASQHPVYVGISAIMACVYLVFLKGWGALWRTLRWFIPFTVFIALLNSLFNTAGTTVLWRAGPISLTLEGTVYGIFVAVMLIGVLTWFACYNEVMTDDKFTYLFGRRLPTLSLVISMISRWIPTMAKRGQVIYESQEALIGHDASRKGQVSRGVRMASVLVGLGMEDSIQTSDSMRARGYGLADRTSYATYRWHSREYVALAVLIALIVVNAILLFAAVRDFAYYPVMSQLHLWWGYIPFAVMLALPLIVELEVVGK